jgi:hypothetical protein
MGDSLRLFRLLRLPAGVQPASADLSPASICSAASSCMPGITWLYVPNAMSIEA